MKRRNILLISLFTFILFALTSCSFISGTTIKKQIVTTLYPQYDMVNKIIGSKSSFAGQFEVSMIVPPGQDSHTYDPSISDLVEIKQADLFIYTSKEMETWVKDIEFSSKTKVLNLSEDERILLEQVEDEHDEHDEHDHSSTKPSHEHNHAHGFDPHYWVYPIYSVYMVEQILDALITLANPAYENDAITREFEANAKAYIDELYSIDEKIKTIVASAKQHTMYFGSPFSFYYWSVKYELDYVLTYATCSTETEPSIADLANIIALMKENNIKYIFSKELVNKEACEMIAYHTGASIIELHSGHNVSVADFNNSEVTYLTILNKNVENLAKMLKVN